MAALRRGQRQCCRPDVLRRRRADHGQRIGSSLQQHPGGSELALLGREHEQGATMRSWELRVHVLKALLDELLHGHRIKLPQEGAEPWQVILRTLLQAFPNLACYLGLPVFEALTKVPHQLAFQHLIDRDLRPIPCLRLSLCAFPFNLASFTPLRILELRVEERRSGCPCPSLVQALRQDPVLAIRAGLVLQQPSLDVRLAEAVAAWQGHR
mmetsp:Transcript_27010/g.68090  ORF Transcript_27010/g.68090 Transcript_27010/m.68090 type:complete len:211 (-) Transcript_27010:1538-2170(-)